jgi:hypothetical protein
MWVGIGILVFFVVVVAVAVHALWYEDMPTVAEDPVETGEEWCGD